MDTLATLHLADLYRDPKMRLPTRIDWARIPAYLDKKWPTPYEAWPCFVGGDDDTAILRDAIPLIESAIGPIAIDTEFTRDRAKKLLTIGLGWRKRDGTIGGVQIMGWVRLGLGARTALSQAISNLCRLKTVIFQNTLADAPRLEEAMGIPFPSGYWSIEDTMLAHAVLWSEWPHTLDFLMSMYSSYPKTKHLSQDDPELYNWGDVVGTLVAWEHLARELKADPATNTIYRDQSLALLPELMRAKKRGILVNAPEIERAYAETSSRITASNRIARAHLGRPINLGSSKALGEYFYGVLGLPVQKNKKSKRQTVDADAIVELRKGIAPAPDLELEERDGVDLDTTLRRCGDGADPVLEARVIYADALQTQSHYLEPGREALALDGRFYPDQLIHAQASGRWSTNDPPLAQLPAFLRGHKTGKYMHPGKAPGDPFEILVSSGGIVMPDPGHVWLGWDWDQIELRLNAALSGDTPTLEAFAKGWDIHTLNACDCLGVPYPPRKTTDLHDHKECFEWRHLIDWNGKDDSRRVFAKRFVYRLDYGGDPKNAGDIPGAKALGLDSRRLVQASNRYLAQHPEKAQWRRETVRHVQETHEIRTFLGRRRRLLGEGNAILREAFNHPMQGGVVDIFNTTFVRIVAALPHLQWVYGMHDAQWWSCPLAQVVATWPKLREIVEAEWKINGVATRFPATFKEHRPSSS